MKKVVIRRNLGMYSVMVCGREYLAVTLLEAINAALKSVETNYLVSGELRDDTLLRDVHRYCKETRGVDIEFRW